ncbi:phosphoenolpyruvate synthase [Terrimonas sp. NA20]|uniref:Phosphoenolpyruvate synthase n=1 Tax=Terrimonas ginsenosidimutans TaxID=2908004 RepID=A0ABS9KVC7_9BACT|nr:phosphoenolpyruvate synthase [Terrimonas ginsenosidimutans]MCG2616281.1 phosphoenolpyruvate synthase [Terrimonas ginsenosidimutans]
MDKYIVGFSQISIQDVGKVGGKNASLGEMFSRLTAKGIPVPDGFATTAFAFDQFLSTNALNEPLQRLMRKLDKVNYRDLEATGEQARRLILQGKLPDHIRESVLYAYRRMQEKHPGSVAVRSSATAEDLPQASFAGQHESYLNISGEEELLKAIQRCYASLYTARAIKYREDNGFAHDRVLLSVGIQQMVRSDLASSGVAFTLEPESGFKNVISISGVWGLGENMVQGTVTPDEFTVFKPTLRLNKQAILQRKLGDKVKTMQYNNDAAALETIVNIDTSAEKRKQFTLSDDEVISISRWCLIIEEHYGKPMDIEWAKDGISGKIFIIQARPETVHSQQNPYIQKVFELQEKGQRIAEGNAVGEKIAAGIARVLSGPGEGEQVKPGEIVVTDITSPDWDPVLKRSAAIVTNKGGRTSHASIVARELGVPAIVGTGNATSVIKDGEVITVSCAGGKTGYVYRGSLSYRTRDIDFSKITKPSSTKAMLIVGDPDQAFKLSFYPNDGVGLMRLEFIVTHSILIHPMALIRFDLLTDAAVKTRIEELTYGYPDKKQYFIDQLSQGIATIAAAFYPKDVIVRTSDFKTNEYANLIGGSIFEPIEENPMLGFRGASRYYNERYREAFALECEALKKVREDMGLTNVKVMIPFCRTIEEANKVVTVMQQNGLDREKDSTLEFYMMVEIPSNVLLAEEFAKIFDGFSIGSNDLTQLVLGVDRDSSVISTVFNEQDPAVKKMIAMAIHKANLSGVKIGLCGQAPSDFPAFAEFLVQQGISSISFNPDALLSGLENINKAEHESRIGAHI